MKRAVRRQIYPSCKSLDIDLCNFNLTQENTTPNTKDTTPAKEKYKEQLADAFSKVSITPPLTPRRILKFCDDPNGSLVFPSRNRSELSPGHLLYEETKYGFLDNTKSKVGHARENLPLPEKVLDAPGLLDDYYLNLLDWDLTTCLPLPSMIPCIYGMGQLRRYGMCQPRNCCINYLDITYE